MTAEIIDLAKERARRAIARFRPNESRDVEVDTLYGPVPKGLGMAEIMALKAAGLAEVRKISSRYTEYRVTLTPAGRRVRDEGKRKAR